MEIGYTYIMCNQRMTALYVGSTGELKKRVYQHKHRFIDGFTKKYNVNRLVYFEKKESLEAARERERQIKMLMRKKKEKLIVSMNPSWEDLSDTLS